MYSRNETDNVTFASEQEAGTDSDGAPTVGFGVSGKLWNGVLVMYDRATGSLWTQIDGRAIEGDREGELLEHVASSYTTWGAWVAEHPDTLVLDKPEDVRGFEHSRYDAYLADPERVFFPELAEGLGELGPKGVVFGVRVARAQAAVTETLMASDGLVNGLVGHVPVTWVRLASTGAVRAFDRRLDGQVLVLAFADEASPDTESLRDVLSGKAVRTDQLTELRVDRAFWYAWKHSHPDSLLLRR